jgi:pimeloyl-ACP methyl ester carboxylesterase
MRHRGCRRILPIVALIALQGCVSAPTTVPIRTVEFRAAAGASDTLVVMLPGIRDEAEQFLNAGFVARNGAEGFDVLAVDAHWGYYADGTIVERLHEDVIEPARRRGYEHIWLLGVSLGGYGSLLYAEQFPDDIRGVVLLAPFLGGRKLAAEINEAGGLRAWSSDGLQGGRFAAGWRSLQKLSRRDPAMIILGYGVSDRYAENYDPLVQVLPASQVYTVEGEHRWTTWTPLWSEIKATGTIQ